ncbi:MAG: acyl carrier protein [Breoghania sp.]|nr:acyl carrier protein [Breoghania sp.]
MQTPPKPDRDEVVHWLHLHVATALSESSEAVDVNVPLTKFDLDSVDSVMMAVDLEKRFSVPVHPELFLNADKSLVEVADLICKTPAA